MSLISNQDLEQFRDLGYFVTEPVFEPSYLEAVRAEFDRLWAEHIAEVEANGDERTIDIARTRAFIGQAHTRSALLAQFVKSPIYLEACAKFIGADADLYYNQVVIKAPERGKHFGWHQDSGYARTKPMEYITCWTAIGRTTVENGCIWVLPKSHKNGVLEHRRNDADSSLDAVLSDETGAVPVPMQPGQVAIFSSFTLHKSGPNISKEVRYGYVPQYHQPNVVMEDTGEPFGDHYPVLRDGQRVD